MIHTINTLLVVVAIELAAALVGEFLRFTLADVLRDFPEIWQPTIDPETGAETPNVWKCWPLEEL